MAGSRNRLQAAFPALIVMLGAGLRLYQLGADGFWFDEIGVARVIQAANPLAMTAGIRNHVMAMPLDYWVGWSVNRVCDSETCLRFPSAVWGTLTLIAAYALFRNFADRRTSLTAMFLLAIMPLSIYYSQELRFYAALQFFFTACSALLLRAVLSNRRLHWLQFAAAMLVGMYFHLYVFLVYVVGFYTLLLRQPNWLPSANRWRHFCLALISVGLGALPGFLIFRSTGGNADLFALDEAVVSLWIGLGWFPNSFRIPAAATIWYAACFVLQVGGVFLVIRRRIQILYPVLLSVITVIGIIVFLNLLSNYSLRGRQIMYLQPLMCLLMAYFLTEISRAADAALQKRSASGAPVRVKALPVLLAVLLFLNLMALSAYYSAQKSLRREISLALINSSQTGATVFFTPAWEVDYYRYYLERLGGGEIMTQLKGKEHIAPGDSRYLPAVACWVTPGNLSEDETQSLIEMGFDYHEFDRIRVPDMQQLWCRE